MFEFQVLLANVIVPSAIVLAFVLSAFAIGRRKRHESDLDENDLDREPVQGGLPESEQLSGVQVAVGAVAAGLAIFVAFGMRIDFSFWPEDAWQRVAIASVIVAGTTALSALILRGRHPTLLSVPVFVGLFVAAGVIFPTGEAWEFLQKEKVRWYSFLIIVPIVCLLASGRFSGRLLGTLALAWIPATVAAAFLTSQSFMKVTEPILAYASVLGVLGIARLIRKDSQFLVGAIPPVIFALAGSVSQAQFNSFLGLRNALSFAAISQVAVVAAFGSILVIKSRSRFEMQGLSSGPTVGRWAHAAVVLFALGGAAAIVAWTCVEAGVDVGGGVSGGAGEDEW